MYNYNIVGFSLNYNVYYDILVTDNFILLLKKKKIWITIVHNSRHPHNNLLGYYYIKVRVFVINTETL